MPGQRSCGAPASGVSPPLRLTVHVTGVTLMT
jgi:hypothetical protein